METFIIYQVKSACCLSLFGIIYLLLIRNLTFYRLNRFFLLSAVVISLLIPAVRINIPSRQSIGMAGIVLDTIFVNSSSVESRTNHAISWNSLATYAYLLMAVLFAGFFIYQLL